jgi:DNA polymerase-3 subunit alpha
LPEGLAASDEIAEKVEFQLQLDKPAPPHFKFTREYAQREGLNYTDDKEYFEYKCWEGLEERLKSIPPELHQQYRERLQYEIEIIEKMGFPGYMLIVWDFINYAKDPSRHPEKYRQKYQGKPIPVGPGRGSAAGSLVAYALKITNIDPIRWGLLFERFLNPERVTLPDIDVDFCQERREEVLEYVKNQYKSTNVGQVVTFQSLQARGVLRDLIRIFGINYSEGDKFVKLVPEGPKVKLSKVLKEEPKIQQKIEEAPLYDRLMKFALALEGIYRGTGTHAAGVVISDTPLWEKSPLYKLSPTEEMAATQYSLNYLEPVNLIKFDFLGLKNLTIIQKAVDFIREQEGVEVDLENLNLEDPKVYQLIRSGKTLGLFQIESEGMRRLAQRLKPTNFNDIIAMLALYRPGPMEAGMLDDYINRKHGREPVSYFFPEFEKPLKPILEPTYGVIVYQEQVMQIVQEIAGFTLGEADIIRRAMGKKNEELMKKYKEEFITRAAERGYTPSNAEALFEKIEKFAGYGFNKSHSAAYAMVTFQTAYLKTYYPTHFFSALLTYEADNTDKIATYLEEARSLGIEILPPDVNGSKGEFQPAGKGQILFGLNGLKGVGEKAIESILKNQPFRDLREFLLKIDSKVNRKVLEVLIKGGALDSFGYSRRTLFENLDRLLEYKRRVEEQQQTLASGNSLFSIVGGEKGASHPPLKLENLPEWDPKTRLEREFEALGFYLSAHPLDPYREQLEQIQYHTSAEREELVDKEGLFVGKVVQLKVKRSKSGRRYGIVTLADFHGKLEIFLFGEELEQLEQIGTGEPIGIRAKVEREGERWRITGRKIFKLEEIGEEALPKGPKYLEFRYRLGERYIQQLSQIYQFLSRLEEGEHRVKLIFELPSGEVVEVLTDFWKSPPSQQRELARLIG